MLLSSKDDGTVGGVSLRFIRLPGEPENGGMFLAHSVVLCPVDGLKLGEGRASSSGDDILGLSGFVAVVIGFASDAGSSGGGEGVIGLLSSLVILSACPV